MGLRKGICYRKVVRAYTRKSKFKKKSYIKVIPPSKIAKFDMGDPKKKYKYEVDLVSKAKVQIRHNAIESARQIINRKLNKKLGMTGYYLKVRIHPHHVLRENRMLTGAGADRMQTGMQQAFGKPVGLAAQVKIGQPLFSAYVDENNLSLATDAMKSSVSRLPCKCSVKVKEIS